LSPTVAEAVRGAAESLRRAGVDEARRDAQVLIGHVLGGGRAIVTGHPERRLTEAESHAFDTAVARRCRREPVSQIVGEREFWSLPFRVTPATLTPRPDSEVLIEAALARVDRAWPSRVLDLGTGTGCLLLALLSELPAAFGIGIDRSTDAIACARANAGRLGLGGRCGFFVGDWGRALGAPFDVIVANPPYVARSELATLPPEVADWEPRTALDGGPDGLDAYRAILADLPRLLAPEGLAALEVGAGQAGAVAGLAGPGLQHVETRTDLAGIDRCLLFKKGKKPLGNQREVH
jgi:release factor glutamine methyltransferase